MQQLRSSLPVLALIVVWGSLIASLSVARYTGYNIGMLDLGNMAQAIADASRGGALRYTGPRGPVSRLGGHAELMYFGLALFYRLWSDPRLLLIIQALLVASGAWPTAQLARQFGWGSRAAWVFAAGYLLLPTAVSAVLFDLHGDTLAMPLLMWLLAALARRAWGWVFVWAILALLCKIYIVAPMGLLALTLLHPRTAPFELATDPHRLWIGLALGSLAASYGAFVIFGLHRWFSPPGINAMTNYVSFYFGSLGQIGWFGLLDRLLNVAAVVLPTALLWRWSPWTTLPALAIMLPAAISTGPGAAYAYTYHHYAAAVPFLVAGSIDGSRRLAQRLSGRRQQRRMQELAMLFGLATLLFHVGLSDTPLGIPFWQSAPGSGLDPSSYGQTSRDRLKDRWLASEVDPDAPIATSNFFAVHLANRSILHLVRYPDEATATNITAQLQTITDAYPDGLFDFLTTSGNGYSGNVAYDWGAIKILMADPNWRLVNAHDGLLHFARQPAPSAVLAQNLRSVASSTPALAQFGDQVALLDASLMQLGPRRWQATLRWQALQPINTSHGFAVSRLGDVAHTRLLHLPITILRPALWETSQVLEEQFVFEVPSDVPAGSYPWRIGWYNSQHLFAAHTDERSRIGNEFVAGELRVP